MADHQARFTEQRGTVRVSCSCGLNLGKHKSWPDARQAHDAHLVDVRVPQLAQFYARR